MRVTGLTIVHTADWQLGKRFSWITGDAAALVREQRLRTVASVGELAMARDADAVLVAGDVFEKNTVETATLRRLLDCLGGFDVPWLLLPGNHDAALSESAWTRLARIGLPPNVHLLTQATPFVVPGIPLTVLPAPLTQRQTTEDTTAYFDDVQTPTGMYRVGLAHGSVTNRLPAASDAKNPISETRAQTAHLDYLALGDWHGTLSIAPKTWYAGTPEPDRFRNNDPGNALVVSLDEPGTEPKVQPVRVGYYTWHTVTRELFERDDLDALGHELSAMSERPTEAIVRLQVSGTVDLALREEVSEQLLTWRARFGFLRVEDTVGARASEADLRALRKHGYLSQAVDELVQIAADAEHADHANADRALQILYSEFQRAVRT